MQAQLELELWKKTEFEKYKLALKTHEAQHLMVCAVTAEGSSRLLSAFIPSTFLMNGKSATDSGRAQCSASWLSSASLRASYRCMGSVHTRARIG